MSYSGIDDCPSLSALEIVGAAVVRDCVFHDNITPPYSAPLALRLATVTVTGCRFINNRTGACGEIDPHDPGAGAIYVDMGYLTVDGCTFESNFGNEAGFIQAVFFGTVNVSGCVIRSSGSLVALIHAGQLPGVSFDLRGNLFVDNTAPLLPPSPAVPFNLIGNTFARNGPVFSTAPGIAAGSLVRANVFTGAGVGLSLPGGASGITVECNDSWGNGEDWDGFDPATGTGNFSADPLYCDPANDDFAVAENSPLLPAFNVCTEPIGAFGQGCGTISIEAESWGRIKGRYR
jgi:hypothetical protein